LVVSFLQNLLNETSTPPELVSMSYGECEAFNGAASNTAFNATFQQAVAEGVSALVASGDHASAGCDVSDEDAVYGIGITGSYRHVRSSFQFNCLLACGHPVTKPASIFLRWAQGSEC